MFKPSRKETPFLAAIFSYLVDFVYSCTVWRGMPRHCFEALPGSLAKTGQFQNATIETPRDESAAKQWEFLAVPH